MYRLSYYSVFLNTYGSEVSCFGFELYIICPSFQSKFYPLTFLDCLCGSSNFFFGFKSFLLDFLLAEICYRWLWGSYCLLVSLASLSFFFTNLFLNSLIRLKASLLDSSYSDKEDWFSSLFCFDEFCLSLKVIFFSSFARFFLLLMPCRTD